MQRRRHLTFDCLEAREVPAAYTIGVPAEVTASPLLTAGDTAPRTSNPSQLYRMVGSPDGLGAYDAGNGTIHVFMNHELGKSTITSPVVGGPAKVGSFVDEWVLRKSDAAVLSGDLAYQSVFVGANPTPVNLAFQGLCSGSLAGPAEGFDRFIYFAGEEATGAASADGKGGQAVAIFGGSAYVLPDLGHYSKENIVAVPNTGTKTVLLISSDAPNFESRLYMYVGDKNPGATNPLVKNGLVGGKLYALVSLTPAKNDESVFHKSDGSLACRWADISAGTSLDDATFYTVLAAAGTFQFVRLEDVAVDPTQNGRAYFASTGSTFAKNGATVNSLGRVYRLSIDVTQPATGATTLQAVLEGDAGDPVVNPDNLAVDASGKVLIQENENGEHRGAFLAGRDASMWLYDPAGAKLARIAEIDQTAVPRGVRSPHGTWETSGAIDTASLFGAGTWLFDVQAALSSATASALAGSPADLNLASGGQLLLLRTFTYSLSAQPNSSAPRAVDDTLAADRNQIISANVLANDTDPLAGTRTASLIKATGGTASLTPAGALTFTPRWGFSGVAEVQYRVTNGAPLSDLGLVSINVTAPPVPLSFRFVAQVYRDVLGREADGPGMALWKGQIDAGMPYSTAARLIAGSHESSVRQVKNFYQTYLGRSADAAGLNGFVAALDAGATIASVKSAILGSAEYFARVGGTNNAVVAAWYLDLLGRPASPGDIAFHAGRLASGTSRSQAALDIALSGEGSNFVVQAYYRAYLRRGADATGLATNSASLSAGGSQALFEGNLLGSGEYLGAI